MIVDNHYDPLGEGRMLYCSSNIKIPKSQTDPFLFPFFFSG